MPRTSPAPRHASSFPPEDWHLLTHLPADVMVAAIEASGNERRTVAEGLAGLDAIAAGRGSDSELVRAVVAAIYTEPDDGALAEPADAPEPAVPLPADAQLPRVLARCRRAAEVLRARADAADAAAYRHWVQQVAVRVSGAARSGGVLGIASEVTVGDAQQALLDELSAALS